MGWGHYMQIYIILSFEAWVCFSFLLTAIGAILIIDIVGCKKENICLDLIPVIT